MDTQVSKFSKMLRDHNVSITESRMQLFRTLLDAEKPLKNGEVAKRTPQVDRVSIYRNLKLFSQLGITHTIIQGWTPLTELAEPFKPHHHHMTCEQCGTVIAIEDDLLENALDTVVSRHNFTLHKHIVELSGICSNCSRTE